MAGQKEWPASDSFLVAVKAGKRASRAWCSDATLSWLADRVQVDIAVPGTRIGDVTGGPEILGAVFGVPILRGDIAPGVLLVKKGEEFFHVRLEEGKVHPGRPEACHEGVCLVEGVMLS